MVVLTKAQGALLPPDVYPVMNSCSIAVNSVFYAGLLEKYEVFQGYILAWKGY